MNTKLNSKETLREIMSLAWAMVKRNGYSISEALATAWRNIKLRIAMKSRIVKFYFQKVDGTIREAYGTLAAALIPPTSDGNAHTKNDTVQTYWDSEKMAWRCFKKANLIDIVY